MNRKTFLKNSCITCMALAIMPSAVLAGGNRKSIKADYKDGILSLPLSQFETSSMVQLRNRNLEYDVLVVKNEDTYSCIKLMCSHEQVPLTASHTKIFCSAHGSVFDLNGQVLEAPAVKPLHQYKYIIIDNIIKITVNE
jgi:nitrite reductase/ring-hydroxylating ferredoxin subunit